MKANLKNKSLALMLIMMLVLGSVSTGATFASPLEFSVGNYEELVSIMDNAIHNTITKFTITFDYDEKIPVGGVSEYDPRLLPDEKKDAAIDNLRDLLLSIDDELESNLYTYNEYRKSMTFNYTYAAVYDPDEDLYNFYIAPTTVTFELSYKNTKAELEEATSIIAGWHNSFMKKHPTSSPVEQLHYIYSRISKTLVYGFYDRANATPEENNLFTEQERNVIKALNGEKVVCEAYAYLLDLAAEYIGLEHDIVTGSAGGNHMWNAIAVDGIWYLADPTWAGSNETERYFLKGVNDWASHTIDFDASSPNFSETEYPYMLASKYLYESELVEDPSILSDNYPKVTDISSNWAWVAVKSPNGNNAEAVVALRKTSENSNPYSVAQMFGKEKEFLQDGETEYFIDFLEPKTEYSVDVLITHGDSYIVDTISFTTLDVSPAENPGDVVDVSNFVFQFDDPVTHEIGFTVKTTDPQFKLAVPSASKYSYQLSPNKNIDLNAAGEEAVGVAQNMEVFDSGSVLFLNPETNTFLHVFFYDDADNLIAHGRQFINTRTLELLVPNQVLDRDPVVEVLDTGEVKINLTFPHDNNIIVGHTRDISVEPEKADVLEILKTCLFSPDVYYKANVFYTVHIQNPHGRSFEIDLLVMHENEYRIITIPITFDDEPIVDPVTPPSEGIVELEGIFTLTEIEGKPAVKVDLSNYREQLEIAKFVGELLPSLEYLPDINYYIAEMASPEHKVNDLLGDTLVLQLNEELPHLIIGLYDENKNPVAFAMYEYVAAEGTPTEPRPTEPTPTEPKPTEPRPTEPKPTEPKPTEPRPTEPKPTEPRPTNPAPAPIVPPITTTEAPTNPPVAEPKEDSTIIIKETMPEELNKSIKQAVERASAKENIVIEIDENLKEIDIPSEALKSLNTNDKNLTIEKAGVRYSIPSNEISPESLATMFGKGVTSENISLAVRVNKIDEDQTKTISKRAENDGMELIGNPIQFEVEIRDNSNKSNQAVKITEFKKYVNRTMEITKQEFEKTIQGVYVDISGNFQPVPTTFYEENGKYYASLKSLTNSTYALVNVKKEVPNVSNHWSEEAVTKMASRLILTEIETFEPDQAITRAEFANYIVRALGLYKDNQYSEDKFRDINKNSEYANSINLANRWGIVSGYEDGTFKPGNTITREEAMKMYSNALAYMDLAKIHENRINEFEDKNLVSKWATPAVNEVLNAGVFNGKSNTLLDPLGTITHAEALQALYNLLTKSLLTN